MPATPDSSPPKRTAIAASGCNPIAGLTTRFRTPNAMKVTPKERVLCATAASGFIGTSGSTDIYAVQLRAGPNLKSVSYTSDLGAG
jgi:hypothetical protein